MATSKARSIGLCLLAVSLRAQAKLFQQTGLHASSDVSYGGTPAKIPVMIQVSKFDLGGNGLAYSGSTAANINEAFIPHKAVDIKAMDVGYDAAHLAAGEYMRYTVDVTKHVDAFQFNFKLAPRDGLRKFRIVSGGTGCHNYETDLSGIVTVPHTRGSSDAEYLDFEVSGNGSGGLPAGPATIWMCAVSNGFFMDSFTMTEDTTPPSVPMQSPRATASKPKPHSSSFPPSPPPYPAPPSPSPPFIKPPGPSPESSPPPHFGFSVLPPIEVSLFPPISISADLSPPTLDAVPTPGPTPEVDEGGAYGGVPAIIPAHVQAEEFDDGIEDSAYSHSTPVNEAAETGGWPGNESDEFAVCNVGSTCREDLRQANGSVWDMWPDETLAVRILRIQTEIDRVRINQYQPPLVPRFTKVGYKKEKLNPETYGYLMEWYNKASRNPTSEKWTPGSSVVNHWKVDTTMVYAPSRICNRLHRDVAQVMEDWAVTRLKPTACYGARLYFRDSVLANHVDLVGTHVISGIINVAQENVDTDWPLYVRGHDGVAQNITMEPGDLVLYESASVIHGRPNAFQGESFANIFVHFAPIEGWNITDGDVQRASVIGARKIRYENRKSMENKATEMEKEGLLLSDR